MSVESVRLRLLLVGPLRLALSIVRDARQADRIQVLIVLSYGLDKPSTAAQFHKATRRS